jgi:hypothetical protein
MPRLSRAKPGIELHPALITIGSHLLATCQKLQADYFARLTCKQQVTAQPVLFVGDK